MVLESFSVNENDVIEDVLRDVCSYDNDFTGWNGEDYLWEEARVFGYNSNLEYSIYMARKTTENDRDFVEKFLDMWFSSDTDFYFDYKICVDVDKEGRVTHIAYAYTS